MPAASAARTPRPRRLGTLAPRRRCPHRRFGDRERPARVAVIDVVRVGIGAGQPGLAGHSALSR